jgi:hypothetical protein
VEVEFDERQGAAKTLGPSSVERVERLRSVQHEALRQAEHLFASMLDCAFSG